MPWVPITKVRQKGLLTSGGSCARQVKQRNAIIRMRADIAPIICRTGGAERGIVPESKPVRCDVTQTRFRPPTRKWKCYDQFNGISDSDTSRGIARRTVPRNL